jgi:tetraprenyl-beta-curcumene synthase
VSNRELAWIRPNVAREVESWRRRAASIPDAVIREDALAALTSKRLNAEGAALFSVLPRRRVAALLRLLVAFQILLDFLDSVSERESADPLANGRQLHLALRDALDPGGPLADYYRHHPRQDDGGYLRALVLSCRESCESLPSYGYVRSLVLKGAARCSVQGLNHDPDAVRRDEMLERWARSEFPRASGVSWWELTAASSSTLGIHALLALAAEPCCAESDALAVEAAYMPWICAASTMLDSYVDEVEDRASNSHSYISHYASPEVASVRTRELVSRSLQEARLLHKGARHTLIAAGMVAMYLSAEDARSESKRETTRAYLRAGGPCTRLLLPILRLWRAPMNSDEHSPPIDAARGGADVRVRNTNARLSQGRAAPKRLGRNVAASAAGRRGLVRTE